jgi:hypothetical protein
MKKVASLKMTYQGTFILDVDVTTNLVSNLPPWDLVDRPDPLIQIIRGQVVGSYPEFIVDVHVLTH